MKQRIGIFDWFGYTIEPEIRFKLIRQAGFDGVMLWWGDEYAVKDGRKELLPGLARQAGLYVENVHMTFQNANEFWLDNSAGESLIAYYLACIDDCKHYEIPTAVLHLTHGYHPPEPSSIGLCRLLRLADHAEKCEVNIAMENLKRPEYLDFVFRNVNSARMKFCFDSGHENYYSNGIDILSKYAARLCCLHLHDNDGTADQHRIPGEGTVNWKRIMSKLNEIRFDGPLSLEVTNEFSVLYNNLTAKDFLNAAYDKTLSLMQEA